MRKIRRYTELYFIVAIMVIGMAGSLWAGSVEQIDINKATAQELTQLKKIGPATAAKIIEYRESNGPFTKPEDIMKVKGIGPSAFEANKDRIIVGVSDTGTKTEQVTKAVTQPVNKAASQLSSGITSQLTETLPKSDDKVTQLETKVRELSNKVLNLEKKIGELEKKIAKP